MTAVTAAALGATAVTAAIVVVTVIVVIAADVGVEGQLAAQQGLDGIVSIAMDAAKEANTRIGKGHLRTGTDASADHGIHAQIAQEGTQGAMAVTGGFYHLGTNDVIVFHLVDLEGSGVAEVLEDHSRFISDCNFHSDLSFTRYSIAANESNVKC